jgi:hypothetical protein
MARFRRDGLGATTVRGRGPARVVTMLATVLLTAGCAGVSPRAASQLPDGAAAPIELADVPFHPQRALQCGPAALASVLTASGVELQPGQLVDAVYLPGRRGSLQAELVAATRSHDRLPYLVEPSLEGLVAQLRAGRPVLVLQKTGAGPWPGWHYAVVVGYDPGRGRLLLRSGAEPRLELSERRFRTTWDRAGRWALVAVAPDEPPVALDAGRYLHAAAGLEAVGRHGAATAAYRSAARAWPRDPLPRIGIANLALAAGDAAHAELELRAALGLAPDDPVVRNNRAVALLALGCPDSARREARWAVEAAAGGAHAAAVAATLREAESAAGADATGCPVKVASAHSRP